MHINNTFGSGSITVQNGGTLTSSGSNTTTVTGTLAVGTSASSTAQATFGAPYSGTSTVSSYGTLHINNTFGSGSITLQDGGTLTSSGSNTTTVTGTLSVGTTTSSTAQATLGAPYSGSSTVSNFGTLTINKAFASGLVTNKGSASLYLASGAATISSAITNNASGQLFVNSQATSTGAIINDGTMTIAARLDGSNSITNDSGATLNLNTGTILAKSITNNAGGNLLVNANITSTNSITNHGLMTLGGDINMTGQNFSNDGTVTVSGNRSVTASNYNSTFNTQEFTITSIPVYDSLSITGNSNMDGDHINVTSSYAGASHTWTIITVTGIYSHVGTLVSVPTSGALFQQWSYSFVGNTLQVSLAAKNFSQIAIGPVNQAIAAALDAMAALPMTNSGQQTLLNALLQAASQQQFNDWLQELVPNLNGNSPSIFLQDKIWSRVETRIASLDDSCSYIDRGFSSGDINPTTALWIGGFGSFAHQSQAGENFGYRSKSFGSLIGIDTKLNRGGVFGLGAGISKAIVYEFSNPYHNTNIVGYHGIMYGTVLPGCNRFLEWLATGAMTDSKGSRAINIANIVMSTTYQYHGGIGGLRLNYGKNFAFGDYFQLAPVGTLQYVLSYQPSYSEIYSPAALNVLTRNWQNVFTVGAGARMTFPVDDWWLVGTRELRAAVTYDAISSNNNVAANFVVGSPNFNLTIAPTSRLAFKTGIDFSILLLDHLLLAVSYDYELRKQYYDHSASAKLKFIF